MLMTATYMCIPRNISILSTVVIAYLVGYILYKIKDFKDLKQFKQDYNNFNPIRCSKYELIKRCKKCGFSKEDIQLAIYLFYDKLHIKEISMLVYLEEQTIRNYKTKFKKQLLNFLKDNPK